MRWHSECNLRACSLDCSRHHLPFLCQLHSKCSPCTLSHFQGTVDSDAPGKKQQAMRQDGSYFPTRNSALVLEHPAHLSLSPSLCPVTRPLETTSGGLDETPLCRFNSSPSPTSSSPSCCVWPQDTQPITSEQGLH